MKRFIPFLLLLPSSSAFAGGIAVLETGRTAQNSQLQSVLLNVSHLVQNAMTYLAALVT